MAFCCVACRLQRHSRCRMTKSTHTIIPAQCPTFHLSFTIGFNRALNESWSKCTKAVERMTPVPKCFPMKKRMLGTRIERNVAVMVGKETAAAALRQLPATEVCKTYLVETPRR